MTGPADSTLRRIAVSAACGAVALAVAACHGDDERSPTAPLSPPAPVASPAPAAPLWTGSWGVDRATPAGDCLADTLNEHRFSYPMVLAVEREEDHIDLRFQLPDLRFGPGFWPVHFAGTVGSGGAVEATLPESQLGSVRTDPWLMDLCYYQWTVEDGYLTATLSADGRTLSGTVVETYRAQVPDTGGTFTVYSQFTAAAP